MPVTLELIAPPSAQDLIDLEKIYTDYPIELPWKVIAKQLENDSELRLYAGRFNDRLLGACTVKERDNTLEITHLCVRKITRKRHVARDILRLLLEVETAKRVTAPFCQEAPAVDILFTNAGFIKTK